MDETQKASVVGTISLSTYGWDCREFGLYREWKVLKLIGAILSRAAPCAVLSASAPVLIQLWQRELQSGTKGIGVWGIGHMGALRSARRRNRSACRELLLNVLPLIVAYSGINVDAFDLHLRNDGRCFEAI